MLSSIETLPSQSQCVNANSKLDDFGTTPVATHDKADNTDGPSKLTTLISIVIIFQYMIFFSHCKLSFFVLYRVSSTVISSRRFNLKKFQAS